jgi:hypothetical protein
MSSEEIPRGRPHFRLQLIIMTQLNLTRHQSPISLREAQALARTLGDTPETVISVHCLNRDLATAWIVGSPENFSAAVIQTVSCPAEPNAFGDDRQGILRLLLGVRGWNCVLADRHVADALGPQIAAQRECSVSFLEDVHSLRHC